MSELLQGIQKITTLHRPTPSHWGKSLNISFDSGYPVIAVDTAFIGRKEAKILVRQEYNAALSDLAGSRLNVNHVFGPPPTFNTDIDDAIFVEREAPFTLSNDHVTALNGPMNFHGFIITGSPGIGKSTFLLYLAVVLMEKKIPFFFQVSQEAVKYVCAEGVYQLSKLQFLDVEPFAADAMWLFDSNFSVFEPWFECVSHVFLVEAASHRPMGLDWSRKSEKFVAVWTMSPPELDEALECARLWGIPRDIAASTYNTFGPSLRLIRRVTTPQRYNQELKSLTDSVDKIVNTSLGTVERILKNSDLGASAADLRLAQQIFLITPAEERHSELLRIMNPFVSDLVIKKLDTLEDQSRGP